MLWEWRDDALGVELREFNQKRPLTNLVLIPPPSPPTANLRSTIKLGSPLYYNKDAWVEIFYDANRDTSRVEQSESLLRRRRVK